MVMLFNVSNYSISHILRQHVRQLHIYTCLYVLFNDARSC